MKRIAATVISGLGNQMFQYAVARRLALVNKAMLILYIDDNYGPNELRDYGLDNFRLPAHIKSSPQNRPATSAKTRLAHMLSRRLLKLESLPVITESRVWDYAASVEMGNMLFHPGILEHRGSVRLVGYWQNERYFAGIQQIIRDDFTFKAPLDERNLALQKRIKNGNSVFLHVRRGDYLAPGIVNWFGVCPPEYYHQALAALRARAGNDLSIYVFSDDPVWVRQNQIGGASAEIIDWNSAAPWRDLALMQGCRHAIIANSSFSWWGAWLGETPGGTVIAPRHWYKKVPAYRDIVPDRWLRL